MSTVETNLAIPQGFRASAVKAGIKPSGALDLALLVSDAPCAAAGTFTTNRVCAAPVKWDRSLVPSRSIRGIVINAGNANAATGAEGEANVAKTAQAAASLIGCAVEAILVASTGIIGHQLPMDKLVAGLSKAHEALSVEDSAFHEASRAIMTTDTKPKVVSKRLAVGNQEISLLGLAKGAAMIGPKMATMLGFFLTDAPVEPEDLQAILSEGVEVSFNCISVEGHMSTNDTVLILSGGDPGRPKLKGNELAAFGSMIKESCIELARMIPEDGEGATHFITIDVEGCLDREEARTIARVVADSALVKTAIHGADPNWGRIVSAAGYSGIPFEEAEVSLRLNGESLYVNGAPVAFDAASVSKSLRENRETSIRLTFQRGEGSIRFWTCDLTAEYVHLNADYTT